MVPLALVTAIVAAETFTSARAVAWASSDRTLLAVMLAVSENLTTSNGDLLAEDTLEVLTESLGDQFLYHFSGPNNAFVTGYGNVPPLPRGAVLEGGVPVFYDGTYGGDPVRVVAMRQLVSGRTLDGWTTITTWQRVSQREGLASALFLRSLARLLLMLGATAGIVWFAVARGLEPLRDLRRAFARRSPRDLSPVRRAVPAELAGIVRTANELFARLRRASTARERWIGDAAHQLKNPVAAVCAQAETALNAPTPEAMRERLRGVVRSTNSLSRLAEQMLTSARLHAGTGPQPEMTNVTELVRDLTAALGSKALARGQTIAFDAPDGAVGAVTDRVLLREAVANLLDNAIVHCPADTEIRVRVGRRESDCAITVADNGPGLPTDDVDALCEPFESHGASSGAGLGLAVVRDVADALGAALALEEGPGGGTRAMIRLAAQPAQAARETDGGRAGLERPALAHANRSIEG